MQKAVIIDDERLARNELKKLLLELQGGEKIEVSRRQAVKFKEMMSL